LCDTGSDIESLSKEFPRVDFSGLDPGFPAKTGRYAYSKSAVLSRGQDILRWIHNRPEQVIAVVSHASFIRTAIAHRQFCNADYRIFDFNDSHEDVMTLKEWPETKENGGWLGREYSGYAGVKEEDFLS
jgi:hypothetical protein